MSLKELLLLFVVVSVVVVVVGRGRVVANQSRLHEAADNDTILADPLCSHVGWIDRVGRCAEQHLAVRMGEYGRRLRIGVFDRWGCVVRALRGRGRENERILLTYA